MKRKCLAAAAAALALATAPAIASKTYEIPLWGTDLVFEDPCSTNMDTICETTKPFHDVLDVTVPDSADGDYYGAGTSISLSYLDFVLTGEDDTQLLIQVTNGAVNIVDSPWAYLSLNGHDFEWHAVVSHTYSENIHASTIPEPTTALLLLVGLGVIASRRRIAA